MEVAVIKIGNSKGLRLSKSILDQYNIQDKVELILEKSHIILKPLNKPRQGWDSAFEKMHNSGDDKPLMTDVFEDENLDEWN